MEDLEIAADALDTEVESAGGLERRYQEQRGMAAATGNGSQTRTAARTGAQATSPAHWSTTRTVPRRAMVSRSARNSSIWGVEVTCGV